MISFFKKQYVFCISSFFAILTCFIIPPSWNYLSYIDLNTLSLLFALMAIVCGFEKCGLFVRLGYFLTSLVHNLRSLSVILIALCFFLSMFITNDVALLTFVPFSIMILKKQKNIPGWILPYVIVLQTVAANTGSMLTPVGNPQNIFLFSKMGKSIPEFMMDIMPYSLISFLFLFGAIFIIPKERVESNFSMEKSDEQNASIINFRTIAYSLTFLLCIFSVAGIIPKIVLLPVIILVVFFVDKSIFVKIDYWLLLTFCAFFIFSGNIASIPQISAFLKKIVSGHEFLAALISSQIISNVPAALLLFPFVEDIKSLLLGVNVGGLGTLVASLASLISFKLYTKDGGRALTYIALFSLINIILLFIMCLFYFSNTSLAMATETMASFE